MAIQINDRQELKRFRKLCSTLDNGSVQFPLTIYTEADQTVAFMAGSVDREFSVKTVGTRQNLTMSDREGARAEWMQKEQAEIQRLLKVGERLVALHADNIEEPPTKPF